MTIMAITAVLSSSLIITKVVSSFIRKNRMIYVTNCIGREELPVEIAGRQVKNETRRRIPAPPVPAGNLSTPQGDAVCYSLEQRFYCVSQFRVQGYLTFFFEFLSIFFIGNSFGRAEILPRDEDEARAFRESRRAGEALRFPIQFAKCITI